MRADRGRRGPPLRGGAAVPPGWWCAARPRGEGAAPAAAALAHTRRLRRGRNPPTPFPEGGTPHAADGCRACGEATPTDADPPLRAPSPPSSHPNIGTNRREDGQGGSANVVRSWTQALFPPFLTPACACAPRPGRRPVPARCHCRRHVRRRRCQGRSPPRHAAPSLPSRPRPCRGFRWRRHTGWTPRCLRGGGERCHGDRRGCSATAAVDGFDVHCISGGVSCAGLGRGGAAAAAGCGTDASAPLKAQSRAVGSPLAAATRW